MYWLPQYILKDDKSAYVQYVLQTPIGKFMTKETAPGVWSLYKDGEYIAPFQSFPDAKAYAEKAVLRMYKALAQFCAGQHTLVDTEGLVSQNQTTGANNEK